MLPDRLARRARASLYLIFNEGYAASRGDVARARRPLRARRSGSRSCSCVLMPDEPEAFGLLALMLLQDSRRDARRRAPTASSCCLADQDRAPLGRARRSTRACGCSSGPRRSGGPGSYQLQAAIAAGHAAGVGCAATVVAAYEALLAARRARRVARLNHAAAVALAGDVEEGLAPDRRDRRARRVPPLPRGAGPTCSGASAAREEARRRLPACARAHRRRAREAVSRGTPGRDQPSTRQNERHARLRQGRLRTARRRSSSLPRRRAR